MPAITPHSPSLPGRLAAYFRSGWAFFIPYVVAYATYAWLRWPATGAPAAQASAWVPSLLHVYWLLHATHAGLAVWLALRGWRGQKANACAQLGLIAPWACLGLLFWIPGPYWEFPADTWAHYIRTIQWESALFVTDNAAWGKWSYYLAYSLVGDGTSRDQLAAFNLYYAGSGLLLSWQYYRLAIAASVNRQTAMIFVFLQAVFAGNDAFGFYRYYGISSSVLAQLGAVAAMRIMLEAFAARNRSPAPPARDFIAAIFASAAAMAFAAANHPQGVAIALLGLMAVGGWACSNTVRGRVALIIGVALLCLVTVGVHPRSDALKAAYASGQWFNAWYGFDVLNVGSAAFNRTVAILGLFGLVNLIAGVALVRANRVVAWLTLLPLVALALPFPAIPIVSLLVAHDDNPANLITFHRFLFAIPPGLALATLAGQLLAIEKTPESRALRWARSAILPLTLALALAPSPTQPSFNRLYNAWTQVPADLDLPTQIDTLRRVSIRAPQDIPTSAVVAIGEMAYASRPTSVAGNESSFQLVSYGTATSFSVEDPLTFPRYRPHELVLVRNGREWYTPWSTIGHLSGHWFPQRAAFISRGSVEFVQGAAGFGYSQLPPLGSNLFVQEPALGPP